MEKSKESNNNHNNKNNNYDNEKNNNSNNYYIHDINNNEKMKNDNKYDDDMYHVPPKSSGEGVGVNGYKNKKNILKKSKNLVTDINFYSPFSSIENKNDDNHEIYDMSLEKKVPVANEMVPSPIRVLSPLKVLNKTSTISQNNKKLGIKKSKDMSIFSVPFPRGVNGYPSETHGGVGASNSIDSLFNPLEYSKLPNISDLENLSESHLISALKISPLIPVPPSPVPQTNGSNYSITNDDKNDNIIYNGKNENIKYDDLNLFDHSIILYNHDNKKIDKKVKINKIKRSKKDKENENEKDKIINDLLNFDFHKNRPKNSENSETDEKLHRRKISSNISPIEIDEIKKRAFFFPILLSSSLQL